MSFEFSVPRDRIAQYPNEKRGHSRILVVSKSKGILFEGIFNEVLPKIVKRGDLIVFNNSKVVKARLQALRKSNNEQIEMLVVEPLASFKWKAFTKGLAKLSEGEELSVGKGSIRYVCREGSFGVFESNLHVSEMLRKYGHTPIPPYIRDGKGDAYDLVRYQTIYAEKEGSIAAPTAGLHFSEESFKILQDQGSECAFITLHIGPSSIVSYLAGYPELFEISPKVANTIKEAKKISRRVIAVGTSTIRALESFALYDQLWGQTNLYIEEGFNFSIVDGFFTNFHLPNSSHLKIVCAFLGKTLAEESYQYALRNGFMFYSYGDCMFCCD